MEPEFTVTEVKDWINGFIAEYRKLTKMFTLGGLAIDNTIVKMAHDVEMLEYIRDNYFSAELLNYILGILNDVLSGNATEENKKELDDLHKKRMEYWDKFNNHVPGRDE